MRLKYRDRQAAFVTSGFTGKQLRLTVICGLLAGSNVALSDDAEVPDMAFLEYLGSWDESDEDWVYFSEVDAEESAASDPEGSDTNPDKKDAKVAELDDEN